jgi:hypothetical protein
MNSVAWAILAPWQRRALAGATVWLVLWPLALAHGQCPPVMPPPNAIYELEPNNTPPLAQPWPFPQPVYGEQTTVGDPDCFLLLGVPPDQAVRFLVVPDTFNPRLRLWGMTAGIWTMLLEADEAGYCEAEQVVYGGWDPCQVAVPVEQLVLQVVRSPLQPPTNGSYLATAELVSSNIPPGDCCAYPIVVGGFPYTDTQTTSASYRDMGFNSSADVWYRLELAQGGLLRAETCAAATTFDTMLWLVGDDCQTVLHSNDDNSLCGPLSTKSHLAWTLLAGTYYVVVEGSGAATGTYQLDLTLATCNQVVPGPGALLELEPNDEWMMAQPWPASMQLFGEQTLMGDADWFRLESAGVHGEYSVTIQPDTFDPVVTAYVLTDLGVVPVATANSGGFCESEQLTFFVDPCAPIHIVGGPYVAVTQNEVGMPMHGHYAGSFSVGPNPIPAGDCCQYPISVGAFPYTDTQATTSGFRDQGFNASADVWYRLDLDQGGVLTAQTCAAATTFDTMLRVLDDDCQTVLDSNNDSNICGLGSSRSWLSKALAAGTCYVMVEGNGNATGTFQLDLSFLGCNAVVPGPGALWELEPNDEPEMAMPWPPELQLYGEQTSAGDPDFFHLILPTLLDGFELMIEADTFDPVVRVHALTEDGLFLMAVADNGGFCQSEAVAVAPWDPCLNLVPLLGWVVEVSPSSQSPLSDGHYLGTATVIPSTVAAGDCCAYPIPVGSLPYSDTQTTSTGFRDMGFGASPDVWYELSLSQGGVLTAHSCGGSSNFDTMLRLLDDDCATVIASNDNSLMCGGGSAQSWLSACVSAGTYYVMVEGGGNASGTFTLNLALRPGAAQARLIAGEWGADAEEWHQRFTDETSHLWLLPDDPCRSIQQVLFRGTSESGAWVVLGVDTDGWEPPMATERVPQPDGDGWFCDFDPGLLRLEPGLIHFAADLTLEDGSLVTVETTSWYAPNLSADWLSLELEREITLHGGILTVYPQPDNQDLTLSWKLGEKVPQWSREVPPEWQRPVSDTHCTPTAAAACLEWLDATYGTNVTGGLSGDELITGLGNAMDTNVGGSGTTGSGLREGLQDWIGDNGGGYTVHTDLHGDTDGMQEQGESQNQDVIATLQWAGGGSHSVTLSSFNNVPNEDGTHTVDFMDPWTGSTQEGSFNPDTGAFSGYGSGSDSGALGSVTYVCPVEQEPGGGGSGEGGSGMGPLVPGGLGIPVQPGWWWLKLTFIDSFGMAAERFHLVRSLAPGEPLVSIELLPESNQVRLSWDPVDDATGYRIYRHVDSFFDVFTMDPWLETDQTEAFDATGPAGTRWCYRVTAVYPR